MDVGKLCRVCCSKKTCSQLEDIYVSIDSMYKNMRPFCLSNFLMDFFDIVISEDDNLPQHICKHCKKEVLQSYKLVKLCYKSDKKLRGLFLGKKGDNGSFSKNKLPKNSYKLMIWKNNYKKTKKKTRLKISDDITGIKRRNIKEEYDNTLENVLKESEKDTGPKNMITANNDTDAYKTNVKEEYENIFEDDIMEKSEEFSVQNTLINNDSFSMTTNNTRDGQYVKLLLKLSTRNSSKTTTIPDNQLSIIQNIMDNNHVDELPNIDSSNIVIKSCLDENNSHQIKKVEALNLMNESLKRSSDTESNCSIDNYVNSDCQKVNQIADDMIDSMNKPYICNICGVALCSKGSLTVHQVTHSSERPYPCDKCNLRFKLKSHLIGHHRNIHEGVKKHFCKICSKSFFGSAQLKIHEMTHTKEYPHLCMHCGKRFAQQSYLRVHQKIHTGIKDLKCGLCDYTSGNKSSMRMHVKGVHEVDKKHQCSDCGLRFMYPSGLEKHMTIHTGIKKHTCGECHKSFRTNANLNDHKRIHSNEKPYSCRHCEKSFRMFTHRTIHERIHTGIKPYICVICSKGFQTRSNLNVHQKTHNKA